MYPARPGRAVPVERLPHGPAENDARSKQQAVAPSRGVFTLFAVTRVLNRVPYYNNAVNVDG